VNSTARDCGDIAAEARQLLDMWENLSRKHVSLGAGCACGIGGITVQLQDFEQDIVDYLLGQSERNGRTDVIAFLQAHAVQSPGALWSMSHLLNALIDEDGTAQPGKDVSRMLLDRLSRTLGSFNKLHG
jgi:hypothetical protein